MSTDDANHWDQIADHGTVLEHTKRADGFTINVVEFREEQDIGPILATLEGGACRCPHWGHVLTGRIDVRYWDGREESFGAGDALYTPPGHTSYRGDAGTRFVLFSPTDLLAEVDEAIAAAMAAQST